MPTPSSSSKDSSAREAALASLTASATANVPGVDFASVTVYGEQQSLTTVAPTDPLAVEIDSLQYELREGPCYAAVTAERFVLINDMPRAKDYPRYAPRAAEIGVQAQAGIQLVHGKQRAGLNLYARQPGAFDRSTVQLAELFATQAAAVLEYAQQVEQLSEALHTRTDIGTAIGILMERYGIGSEQAFSFLVRNSNRRNVKIRVLAKEIMRSVAPSADRNASSELRP